LIETTRRRARFQISVGCVLATCRQLFHLLLSTCAAHVRCTGGAASQTGDAV